MIDVDKLSVEEKAELLRELIDSSLITATGLYGAEEELEPDMVRIEGQEIFIDTGIFTG